MGEPCPAPLRVAMRSPLPFPCVPDRPYKILLVQVGTLSFSHPSFGVPVLFIYLLGTGLARTLGTNTKQTNQTEGWAEDKVPTCASRVLEGRSGKQGNGSGERIATRRGAGQGSPTRQGRPRDSSLV